MTWNCAACSVAVPDSTEPCEIQDDVSFDILGVCQACATAALRCSCCNVGLHNPQNLNPRDGRNHPVCTECMDHHFTCGQCSALGNTERARNVEGARWCVACFERQFYSCQNCGQQGRRDGPTGGDGYYCRRCLRCRIIHDYSYRPSPRFHGPGPLWYGVELEVECGEVDPGDVAEKVTQQSNGLVYAKHDGSISHGFECVSHPWSWPWLEEGGGEVWRGILATMRESECRSFDTTTCGMHVHITKSGLKPQQLLRLQRLAHINANLILKLSRRKKENLERWANPRDTDIREQRALARGDQERKENRYSAVNVTRHTVEIRIFRGTCDEAGFFANLETVKAMVDYSATIETLFPRGDKFIDFVRENAKSYPNMVTKLVKERV